MLYLYFLILFCSLFFTSSPETVTLYLPSSSFLMTLSQVSKSAAIQSFIVFKAGVSFINSSLSLFLRRQNEKSTRSFPKSEPENHLVDHENHHGSKQLKPGENHFPYPALPGFPDPSPKNRLVDFPLSRGYFPKSSPASFPIFGT